ncbi:MAG: hypothetical protein HUJ65_07960 [Oscillospiraceae bacterium]|nr:hypothetical protein [Oscillospiraceae bacterium]
MKKVLSVILILCMLFALVACGADKEPAAPKDEPSPAPAEPADNSPAAPEDAPSPLPEEPDGESTIGWGTDKVDHFARDTYDIVYMVNFYLPVNVGMSNMFEIWAKCLNCNYQVQDCEQDNEKYLNYLETFAVQGKDGFILDFDPFVTDRIFEAATELGLNWIPAVNPVCDENGKYLLPAVCINAYDMGVAMTNSLSEFAATQFAGIDQSQLCLIALDITTVPDLHNRALGSADTFKQLYPEANVIIHDMTGKGMTAEVGYDEIGTVIAANTQYQYWFVTCPTENFALGGARKAEDLTMTDRVLISCCDGNALMTEWDAGYEGC